MTDWAVVRALFEQSHVVDPLTTDVEDGRLPYFAAELMGAERRLEQLHQAIVARGDGCVRPMVREFRRVHEPSGWPAWSDNAHMAAFLALLEIDTPQAVRAAVSYMTRGDMTVALFDKAFPPLRDGDSAHISDAVCDALETSSDFEQRSALAGVLSERVERSERIFRLLVGHFVESGARDLGLSAANLGMYGDARGLDVLRARVDELPDEPPIDDTGLTIYVELRGALTALLNGADGARDAKLRRYVDHGVERAARHPSSRADGLFAATHDRRGRELSHPEAPATASPGANAVTAAASRNCSAEGDASRDGSLPEDFAILSAGI
jgi:hypothetical protein